MFDTLTTNLRSYHDLLLSFRQSHTLRQRCTPGQQVLYRGMSGSQIDRVSNARSGSPARHRSLEPHLTLSTDPIGTTRQVTPPRVRRGNDANKANIRIELTGSTINFWLSTYRP